MDKEEILRILGNPDSFKENDNGSALIGLIQSETFNVIITIPFQVTELFFEVQCKKGNILLQDWHDFYGNLEHEDFKESLHEIADIIKSPILRLTNDGRTVEAKGYSWYFWFGKFSNPKNHE